MKLTQKQVQHLSQQQIQSFQLLQMGTLELEAYLQQLTQENPVVELTEPDIYVPAGRDLNFTPYLRWLEETDYQNRWYRTSEDSFHPLDLASTTGGLEETLERFLLRQLSGMTPDSPTLQAARYLAALLDDSGYLHVQLDELAHLTALPLPVLEEALQLIRSLEPAGVGAASLSQCLELQLLRIGYTGLALSMVREDLSLLAKHHYRAIAEKHGVTLKEVYQARSVILELEPRPGAPFEHPENIPYIQPDIIITREDGRFVPRLCTKPSSRLSLQPYYQQLLSQTDQPELRTYLNEKLQQAQQVLHGLRQRESTLMRCASAIAARQQSFFLSGPSALSPMLMNELAQELEVHESTISRTIREKYIQCPHGTYPMRYFFSKPCSTDTQEQGGVSAVSAQTLMQQLLGQEDPLHPLSDQALCEKMNQLGCPITRRTVTKYREELNIPNTYGRRKH